MNQPFLIIVTGQPGAGKTTFAEALSKAAWLPLISRDRIKEGCVHTWEQSKEPFPLEANLLATNLFFEIVEQMLLGGCSLIAEAAFQHKLWAERLTPLMDKAKIRICICAPSNPELALERFLQRGLNDANRGRFHGDKGVEMMRQGIKPVFSTYVEPHLPVPLYHIDTTDIYKPSINELIPVLFQL